MYVSFLFSTASAKKKIKEKDQRLAEEKRRQQEEEERQMLEEKKRLELIAAQRKAKLVDQNQAAVSRCDGNSKRNNMAASVAPWSNISDVAMTNVVNSPLNFAEIQKAERERRAESYRMEQSLREQQTQAILEQQQQKDAIPKWKLKPQANQIKSLAEIQAEESKAKQSNIQQISTTNVSLLCQLLSNQFDKLVVFVSDPDEIAECEKGREMVVGFAMDDAR